MINYIDLEYPQLHDKFHTIQIALIDVRAADDIRISYDFDRDGWKVEHEEIIKDDSGYHRTNNWFEIAFIKSWGRVKKSNKPIVIDETTGFAK